MSIEYECHHEELLQEYGLKLKELDKEVQFKKEKIDKLQDSVEKIDEKLDKLIRQSDKKDFDIENRVTSVETTLKTLKWVLAIGLTAIGTATTILAFIMTLIH